MASGRRKRARRHGKAAAGDTGSAAASEDAGAAPENAVQPKLKAPSAEYRDAETGAVLTLRGSLTPRARREYADTLAGRGATAAATSEDIAQRAFELLFERLAVSWEIAGAPIERQRELLDRFRAATAEERRFVRGALREHCAERFPEVQAP